MKLYKLGKYYSCSVPNYADEFLLGMTPIQNPKVDTNLKSG